MLSGFYRTEGLGDKKGIKSVWKKILRMQMCIKTGVSKLTNRNMRKKKKMLASSTFINLWKTLQFAGLGNWERGFGKRHEPELQSWKTCISLLHLDGGMLSPFSWTRMPTGGLPWALRSWGPVRWGCFSPEPLHPPCRELPISNGTRSGPLTQGSPTKYFCHLMSLFSPFRGFLLLFFP